LRRFSDAARDGDLDRLVSLLAGDVVMHTDGGGRAAALRLPIHGPENVARAGVTGLQRLLTLGVDQRFVEINGRPGIVSYLDGRPQSVFTIEARDGRIHAIFILTNPEKLAHIEPLPRAS
jgi:RNA polymerase sigma-70 factor (ECF subfamily)